MPTYTLNFGTWTQTSFGFQMWGAPSNAEFLDLAYAEAGIDGTGNPTETLIGTGTISTVPAVTETLVSIVMTVTRVNGAFGPDCHDSSVQLVKAGSPTGPNKATGTAWPSVFPGPGPGSTTYTWSASDLSGMPLTATDVADPGFGVSLSVAGIAGGQPSIDAITLFITTTMGVLTQTLPVFLPPFSTSGA